MCLEHTSDSCRRVLSARIGERGAVRLLLFVVVLLVTGLSPALAEGQPLRGVALVIGQSDYETLDDLPNPGRDARAMDDLLDDLGFDVTRVLDAGADKLRERIAEFIEDAARADVALIYYSGHGVELGGRNYLIPTDTDLSTPAKAGESIVSLDQMLDELVRAVPVTVVLLDACRTEAFPRGQVIELPGGEQVAIEGPGLEAVRGPTPIARPDVPTANLGMVIGFAAAPGQAALDGPPGGNSPYAAALLKHLGAGGYSFADVMTMVGEEVYLRTGARQLPWVNSSLRRILSFGDVPNDGDEDRAAIREGRRELLLTIAGAPGDMRHYVETVAATEGLSLDALYGMLKVLGVDPAAGPADLERQLLDGVRHIKDLKAGTPETVLQDVELLRLSGLAGEAQEEGAIDLALRFREQATARARELSGERDRLEAQLAADRLEIAATYGIHAETAALNFDHTTAAAMFREAYEEVQRWDDEAALHYKWNEGQALKNEGDMRGLNEPLRAAIAAYTVALGLAPRETRPVEWAGLQNNLGNVYLALAERVGDGQALALAIDAFHAALDVSRREAAPVDWAMAQNNLGIALVARSYRETGRASLDEAVVVFEAALEVRTREAAPLEWATTQNNLGIALKVLGDRTKEIALTERAAETFRQALEVNTRDLTPLEWAMVHSNYGNALSVIGNAYPSSGALEQALEAYEAALLEYRQDSTPLDWAMTRNNLAVTLRAIGERDNNLESIAEAADVYFDVLAMLDRGTAPQIWAMTQNNLGVALSSLASRLGNPELVERTIEAYRAALEVYTPEVNPTEWLSAQTGLANQLVTLAFLRNDDVPTLEAAVVEHRIGLAVIERNGNPHSWALLQQSLALALDSLSAQTGDLAMLDEAIAAGKAGREVFEAAGYDISTLDDWIANMETRRASLAG